MKIICQVSGIVIKAVPLPWLPLPLIHASILHLLNVGAVIPRHLSDSCYLPAPTHFGLVVSNQCPTGIRVQQSSHLKVDSGTTLQCEPPPEHPVDQGKNSSESSSLADFLCFLFLLSSPLYRLFPKSNVQLLGNLNQDSHMPAE